MRVLGTVVRFIVAAIVLMLIGYVVPGFSRLTFGEALLAALVIAAVSYLIELMLGKHNSTYGRGIVGFLVSAVVIWLVQFVIPNMHVSLIGALLAAFVIGVVDLVIPTAIR
ncbi:MAG: phage holin family protein [Thermaerobacter sp.]|nr:phage holin family protein [Thermaerobacter sp.]